VNRNKIAEASETAQRRPANLTRPGRSASGQGLKIRALSEPRLSANRRVDRPLRKLGFHNVPYAPTTRRAVVVARIWQPTKVRTTKLYDRTSDEITLEEVERILI
jgi:hypothetical protein